MKQVMLNPFANHMTINVNVLGRFVEGAVVSDVSC